MEAVADTAEVVTEVDVVEAASQLPTLHLLGAADGRDAAIPILELQQHESLRICTNGHHL